MLLNNKWVNYEIKKSIKIQLETKESENATTPNVWDTAMEILRGKFIAIQAYLQKQEKSQINSLTLNLKELEKKEHIKPKVSRKKKIIKIRVEIKKKMSRVYKNNPKGQ